MTVTVYLAGKISKNDWRHTLVSSLHGKLWADAPLARNGYVYTGPFFIADDHGSFHGPSTHGALGGTDCASPYGDSLTSKDVIQYDMAGLAAASLVFAYITAPDCHGTMGEIGWAIAKRKRVVICFAPEVDHTDFWFWAEQAHMAHVQVRVCCLRRIFDEEITMASARTCFHRRGGKHE